MLNPLLPRVAFSGEKKSKTFQVSRIIKNENRSHIRILASLGNLSDSLDNLSDTETLKQLNNYLSIQLYSQVGNPQTAIALEGGAA